MSEHCCQMFRHLVHLIVCFCFFIFSWRSFSHLYFRRSSCSLALDKVTVIMTFQLQTTCSNTSAYSEYTRSCPKGWHVMVSKESMLLSVRWGKPFSIFIILETQESIWYLSSLSLFFFFFFKIRIANLKILFCRKVGHGSNIVCVNGQYISINVLKAFQLEQQLLVI